MWFDGTTCFQLYSEFRHHIHHRSPAFLCVWKSHVRQNIYKSFDAEKFITSLTESAAIMKFSVVLILVLACATLTLACSKKCQKKKERAALEKACAEISGGTKIKLEIDIAGGGCRPPCKKKKKKPAPQEDMPAENEGDQPPADPPAEEMPPAEEAPADPPAEEAQMEA